MSRLFVSPRAGARQPGRRMVAMWMSHFVIVASFLNLGPASLASTPTEREGKDLFGWAEKVILGVENLHLEAKLDTGADTSSLHAQNIRRVRRGEKRLVRFEIEDDESGEIISVARPLVRRARIKRHSGEHQRRYVVTIDVCLGSHLLRDVEVSLIDRSAFQYPVLLGRSALEGVAVVDPAVTFTAAPTCPMSESETTEDAP